MEEKKYVFGMIGLGTMGSNLLLNMIDHGFAVSGYDKDTDRVKELNKQSDSNGFRGYSDIEEFVQSLKTPRAIMMLVPAGKIVDDVIAELTPLLDKGDILIDGGNSYFSDTGRRTVELDSEGLHFFGMGISGGEEGARRGPSMMPGGNADAYLHLKELFESISAQVNGEPCVSYIGPGASGHYVKMVHNGIEYALMQIIAETYQILKTGLGMDNSAIQKVFMMWNEGRLQSFLLEITAEIFNYKNADDDEFLVDQIKDEAKSKGTGKWTSQSAMDLQVSTTIIDTAVSMRDLSKYKSLRTQISKLYSDEGIQTTLTNDLTDYLLKMEEAFYFSMVNIYAQGMHLLFKASETHSYNLQLDQIAKIWRGGCIIRSSFLDIIYNAYQKNTELEHLLADETVQKLVRRSLPAMREIVSSAMTQGIAIPAYAASLSYFDTIRSKRMPSNLIQAQRDFFGAHTYELVGKEGVYHTDWNEQAGVINTKN